MKIMLICSAKFAEKETFFAQSLGELGHEVTYTSGYDEPKSDNEEWLDYGARMLKKSIGTIQSVDAVLCLNFDKDGRKNYIGGATFCEIAYAFEHGKKIFILNDLPQDGDDGPNIRFELDMFQPVILHGDLSKIV